MLVKQSSAGVLCHCIYCHSIFKLFSYHAENGTIHSEFECDCGRVIKIEETKTHSKCDLSEWSMVPLLFKEVQKR